MTHQIILIGKDIVPAYHGIKELKPDHIHLLFTNETKTVADSMFALLPKELECTSYLVRPYDAECVIKVCREIHGHYEGEFYYNLSKGTKLMAFSAFSVAREFNAHPFYLTQRGEIIYLNNFDKSRLKTLLDNQELLKLHDNVLLNYSDTDNLPEEDITASKQIKQFVEQYSREHERIQTFYNSNCKRRLELLPKTHLFPNGLRFLQDGGTLVVSLEEDILLHLTTVNGAMLYFDGRWWETLIADQVNIWRERQTCVPQVWQNVIFYVNETNTNIKNEIDILINNGQKLIFIECKSGRVNQNDVYKVDSTREIYGGDVSKAILASYYPIKKDLLDKCESLQIYCFAPEFFAARLHFIDTLPDWLDELVRELQI
ncbi:MAG: DUF1887 family CARF protein [Tannerellaceae bacterium]|nr:DUF1887 family CARF protein [Tannerellaceae bacterium]